VGYRTSRSAKKYQQNGQRVSTFRKKVAHLQAGELGKRYQIGTSTTLHVVVNCQSVRVKVSSAYLAVQCSTPRFGQPAPMAPRKRFSPMCNCLPGPGVIKQMILLRICIAYHKFCQAPAAIWQAFPGKWGQDNVVGKTHKRS